ncbi:MAG: YfhO family protein, partial [Chloroflexota bacterium]|nr:YfhO family protein [Chloroflexota bacterium]
PGKGPPGKGPPGKGPPGKGPPGKRSLRLAPLLAGAPLLAAVLLAANTTTARPLWLDPLVERRVSGPQLVGTENATFGAGTTTGGEFVPRSADLEALGPGKRRGNGVYERLYPEFGWLAGRARVLDGRLRVVALAAGPTWTEAEVDAETPGVLAFRTIAFPGWRAYLDGREVQADLAPWDEALEVSPGFLTVPVPAGPHRVQIAFTPTRLRTLAGAVSVAALAVLGWWLVRPRRGDAPNASSPRLDFGRSRSRGSERAFGPLWGAESRRRSRFQRSPLRGAGRDASPAPVLALLPAALLALSCTHDALRPAFGAPAVPRPADGRLAADLLELARSGAATAASPSGSGLGPFVQLQDLTIGAHERRWLYMHPPASLSASLLLPQRAAFQAGLALHPQTWHAEGADGVRFILDVTPAGGETVRVLDEHVNPRARDEQRAWLDRWIDLSAFGGRRVTLTLRTEGVQTPDFDWAGWADPVVIVQGDARRPGNGPPAPLPTPRAS